MTVFVVVGGGSKVALRFTRLATQAKHTVYGLVRNDSHDDEIKAVGGTPTPYSLEDDSVATLSKLLTDLKAEAVLFSAGAGGKGGAERTRRVDYEGALKVFDAMEEAKVARICMISAADLRDRSQPPPSHYNEADLAMSDRMWKAIPAYMQAKYEADINLLSRSSLEHIILRPGGLTENPSTGFIQLGNPHLGQVSREDVAGVALALLEKKNAKGLVLDLMGPTEEEKGETWKDAVDRVAGEKTVV